MKNHLKRKDLIASREEKEGLGFPGGVGESGDKTSGLTKPGCCQHSKLNQDPRKGVP